MSKQTREIKKNEKRRKKQEKKSLIDHSESLDKFFNASYSSIKNYSSKIVKLKNKEARILFQQERDKINKELELRQSALDYAKRLDVDVKKHYVSSFKKIEEDIKNETDIHIKKQLEDDKRILKKKYDIEKNKSEKYLEYEKDRYEKEKDIQLKYNAETKEIMRLRRATEKKENSILKEHRVDVKKGLSAFHEDLKKNAPELTLMLSLAKGIFGLFNFGGKDTKAHNASGSRNIKEPQTVGDASSSGSNKWDSEGGPGAGGWKSSDDKKGRSSRIDSDDAYERFSNWWKVDGGSGEDRDSIDGDSGNSDDRIDRDPDDAKHRKSEADNYKEESLHSTRRDNKEDGASELGLSNFRKTIEPLLNVNGEILQELKESTISLTKTIEPLLNVNGEILQELKESTNSSSEISTEDSDDVEPESETKSFSDKIKNGMSGLGDKFNNFGSGLGDKLGKLGSGVRNMGQSISGGIGKMASSMGSAIASMAGAMWAGFVSVVGAIAPFVLAGIAIAAGVYALVKIANGIVDYFNLGKRAGVNAKKGKVIVDNQSDAISELDDVNKNKDLSYVEKLQNSSRSMSLKTSKFFKEYNVMYNELAENAYNKDTVGGKVEGLIWQGVAGLENIKSKTVDYITGNDTYMKERRIEKEKEEKEKPPFGRVISDDGEILSKNINNIGIEAPEQKSASELLMAVEESKNIANANSQNISNTIANNAPSDNSSLPYLSRVADSVDALAEKIEESNLTNSII